MTRAALAALALAVATAASPLVAEDAALVRALALLDKVRPMLGKAASQLQEGKADRPQGDSALDTYRDVLQLDPDNAVAEQGIIQVQRVVLDKALAAVAQNDFTAADAALAEAATILPESQGLQDTRGRIEGMRRQSGSAMLAPARHFGSSDAVGSWKTIWSWVRSARYPPSFASSARPRNKIVPDVGGMSPTMARPSVVLPLPDSPTSATQRPRSTANETASTAGVADRLDR